MLTLSSGIAIYFFSPLWPFRVTTAVSLDGQPTELLDLEDHDAPFEQDGAETQPSQVVWWVDGLENTQHNLFISVGEGEDLAIVDQLVCVYHIFERVVRILRLVLE